MVPAPDPIRLAVPKAFITLAGGANGSPDVALSIFRHLRERLAPYKRIRCIEFGDLPKTSTGKIQKYVLRAREWQDRERRIN